MIAVDAATGLVGIPLLLAGMLAIVGSQARRSWYSQAARSAHDDARMDRVALWLRRTAFAFLVLAVLGFGVLVVTS